MLTIIKTEELWTETTMRYHSTPIKRAKIKNKILIIPDVSRDAEQLDHSSIASENVK